jgi:MoxR-like ATPase
MRASQALAALHGAAYVTPDHVQRLAVPVLAHRVLLKPHARVEGTTGARVVTDAVQRVPVPIEP